MLGALSVVARTRFGENLTSDLAKRHMAQLHDVKEAKQACAAPYAETISEFTPKADIDLLNPRIDPYKDRRLSLNTRKRSPAL